ncbi:MAG: hypothetical protein ACPGR8_15095 [Limisphaerales bacterium]
MWHILAAAALAQNCLHDYLLSREDSCYFGSDSSRVALLEEIGAIIDDCDLETCVCKGSMAESKCDAFAVQAMMGFVHGIHGEQTTSTPDIFKNMSRALTETCEKKGNINEPSHHSLSYSFGACGPTNLPSAGHNAGIVAYVSTLAGLATFCYLYSDQVGSTPVGKYIPVPSTEKPPQEKETGTLM